MPGKTDDASFSAELSPVCSYLSAALHTIPDVQSACLTGSRIEPEAFTIFSDTDLIVFTQNSSYTEFWSDLAASLRDQVQGLILHLENPYGLEERAPLLVHRLIYEHIHLCGTPPNDFLKLPNPHSLRAQAVFRVQEIVGSLQTLLSEHPYRVFEPLRDAWILRKILVEILRYHYLIQSPSETSLSTIIHRALIDESMSEDNRILLQMLHQAAAESFPPQVTPHEVRAWYRRSLEFVRVLQARIMDTIALNPD